VMGKEEIIFIAGTTVDRFLMLVKGKLKVELDYVHSFYQIANVHKGFHYGEILMYSNEASKVNIKVKTTKAEVFFLTKIQMKEIQVNFPEQSKNNLKFSFRIHKLLEKRIKLAMEYYQKHGNTNMRMNTLVYQSYQTNKNIPNNTENSEVYDSNNSVEKISGNFF